MTTITTRTVNLSVIMPVLTDYIRDVISPISSTTRTSTITIPSDVETDDFLIVFAANRSYSYIVMDGSWSNITSPGGASFRAVETLPEDSPPPACTLQTFAKVLDVTDAGTDLTVSWEISGWTPPDDETIYATGNHVPILFAVVLKHQLVDSWDGAIGYNSDFDGDLAMDSFTINTPSIVFYARTVYETASVDSPVGVTELCNHTANGNSLYVGATVKSTSVASWSVDSGTQNVSAWMTFYLV